LYKPAMQPGGQLVCARSRSPGARPIPAMVCVVPTRQEEKPPAAVRLGAGRASYDLVAAYRAARCN